jgi:hypothetical protein
VRYCLRHPAGLHRRFADRLPELRRQTAQGLHRHRREFQRVRVLPQRLAGGREGRHCGLVGLRVRLEVLRFEVFGVEIIRFEVLGVEILRVLVGWFEVVRVRVDEFVRVEGFVQVDEFVRFEAIPGSGVPREGGWLTSVPRRAPTTGS